MLEEIGPRLLGYLKEGYQGALGEPGSISIEPYPPSAYLTELVFRVVKRCDISESDVEKKVQRWSRNEINKQVALITAGSRNGDPLQLAYALILAVTTVPEQRNTPEDKEIFSHALSLFFAAQKEDGTWPLSRPMFHYQKVGSAYAFEYEALTRLLTCEQLQEELLAYIPNLELSAINLRRSSFDLEPNDPGKIIAWASGHHPQLQGPESWSTASVYHFAYALDRLVSEAVRRALFQELRLIYPGPPKTSETPPADDGISTFAPKFLDAELRVEGRQHESLRNALAKHFVYPIARESELVRRGGQLSNTTPMSAILFGPPGTSKTELANIIAGYLHWPLLSVDPSYVVQEGLDKVQAMANRLFGMLLAVEQVVVLLDEFDELGRDRAGNANLLSRFITTAMLPKLAAINKERKIVFLLATNYLSGFDAAFRRGGRFDMQLQVMQPSLEAKLTVDEKVLSGWKERLNKAIELADQVGQGLAIKDHLADLTFLETKKVVEELSGVTDASKVVEIVATAWKACTLEKSNDTGPRGREDNHNQRNRPLMLSPKSGPLISNDGGALPTWRATSLAEAGEIRLPPIIRSTQR